MVAFYVPGRWWLSVCYKLAMLRRRLLMAVGPLVGLMLVTAIAGVWLLEDTLYNLDYVNQQVMGTTERVGDFVIAVRDVRRGLHELALGHKSEAAAMAASMAQSEQLLDEINQSVFIHEAATAAALKPVQYQLPDLKRIITGLAAAPVVTPAQIDAPMAEANAIDRDATHLAQISREQAHTEHQRLSDRFRRQVLILSLVFLLTINLSVIALMRAAGMILRPVDSLVKAAHELGLEHFEARAQTDNESDEFGQLAHAYNHMAQQLQTNEQRKVEVLGQVALTMNHELNNALSVIELQLTLLSRHAGDSEALQKHLKQIRQSLRQMSGVVDDLRNARRIVLTDYIGGAKMLDLRQSVQQARAIEGLAAHHSA